MTIIYYNLPRANYQEQSTCDTIRNGAAVVVLVDFYIPLRNKYQGWMEDTQGTMLVLFIERGKSVCGKLFNYRVLMHINNTF